MLHPGHISVSQAPADLVESHQTVGHSGSGAQGNEGVHVGRTAPQSLKSHLVVLVVDIHDGQQQKHLGQGVNESIFRAMEEARNGQTHHMPHGEIKEGNKKAEGDDKPPLHGGELLLHVRDPGSFGRFPGGLPRQTGPITRLHYGSNNGITVLPGGVKVHLHGAAQQVHVDLPHSLQLADSLLHMG